MHEINYSLARNLETMCLAITYFQSICPASSNFLFSQWWCLICQRNARWYDAVFINHSIILIIDYLNNQLTDCFSRTFEATSYNQWREHKWHNISKWLHGMNYIFMSKLFIHTPLMCNNKFYDIIHLHISNVQYAVNSTINSSSSLP